MSLFEETYDNLLADIYVITKRDDLAEETEMALRNATLSVHSAGAYPRDICTELIKYNSPVYMTSINASELLPRLRGIATLQVCDVNFNPVNTPEIEVVEIGDIRDPVYRTLKTNVAYLAGNALNVRSNYSFYGVLVEYYQLPRVQRANYDSWIAQLFPEIIAVTAAIGVFAKSGNEEKSTFYQKLLNAEIKPRFDANFLTSVMR